MKHATASYCLFLSAYLLARLPLSLLKGIANVTAWIWLWLDARESRVARRNLQLVYPQLSLPERTQLHRQILQVTAWQLIDMIRTWTRQTAENLSFIRQIHGQDLYTNAQAAGKGIIIAAPHYGNWELLNQWLAKLGPITIVYRPPNIAIADTFLQRVRGRGNVQQIPAEGSAVRQLLRVLKHGGTVGILPDQQPKMGEGVFAPFFGRPAFTMTLVSRLAQRTGATVLFAWCERSPVDHLNFSVHIEPANPDIAHTDLQIATSSLNASVERIARRDPSQYQWTYKRFTRQPDGSNGPDPYATAKHRH